MENLNHELKSLDQYYTDKKFKKDVTSILYGLFLSFGEILQVSKESFFFKVLYCVLYIEQFTTCFLGTVLFLFTTSRKVGVGLIYFVVVASTSFFIDVLIDLITAGFCRNNFRHLFRMIDNDFENPLTKPINDMKDEFTLQLIEIKKNAIRIFLYQLPLAVIFVITRPINFFWLEENERRFTLNYFASPTHFTEQVDSIPEYLTLFTFQALGRVQTLIKCSALGSFLHIIRSSFFNTFLYFAYNMRKDSDKLLKVLEEIQILEINYEKNNQIRKSLNRRKNIVVEEYFKTFEFYIHTHKHLIRTIEYLRQYASWILTGFLLATAAWSIPVICYLTMSTEVPIGTKIAGFATTMTSISFLYQLCSLGTSFEKMNTLIADEVYNIPWYLLTPDKRKNIQTFLVLCQRPIQFYALGIYPVSIVTFPKVLNFCYGASNILRRVHQRQN